MNLTTITETGTNCLTAAEDALREAIGASEAWRALVALPDAEEIATEAEGLARVWVDHVEGPVDGLAFTREELDGAGVLAMVTDMKGEEGYSLYFATGQGVTTSQFRIVAVFELANEVSNENSGYNQARRFKNAFIPLVDEVATALLATKGPRWLQSITADTPAKLPDEWDQGDIVGYRYQASIAVTVGPGAEE